MRKRLRQCIHCGSWIDLDFGKDSPAEHAGAAGTKDDPRSPGDYDDVCDVCWYGKGRPSAQKESRPDPLYD